MDLDDQLIAFKQKKSCKLWIVLVTWLFLSRHFTQLPRWGADLVGRLVTSIQPASGLPGALASAVCFLSHQTQPKPHIASYRIIWHHTYFACLISMFPIQSVATFTYFYQTTNWADLPAWCTAPGCKQKPNQTSTRIKLWVFPDVDQDGSGLAFPDVQPCRVYVYVLSLYYTQHIVNNDNSDL